MKRQSCIKCGNNKSPGETECPNCGVIHAKAELAQERGKKAEQDKIDQETPEEHFREKTVTTTARRNKSTGALTTCRACGREISKNAESCPGCGEPITKKKGTAPGPGAGKIGCGGAILILFLIGFIASLSDSGKRKIEPENPLPIGQQQRNAVEYVAMGIAQNGLRSPSTAEFVHGTTKVFNVGPGEYEVGGQVDAQNGFGGTIRNIWVVQLKAVEPCNDYDRYACWNVVIGPVYTER